MAQEWLGSIQCDDIYRVILFPHDQIVVESNHSNRFDVLLYFGTLPSPSSPSPYHNAAASLSNLANSLPLSSTSFLAFIRM